MDVTTQEFKHCVLVEASGRIDSQTAPRLQEAFDELLEEDRYTIVFDMSEVEFLSSAGLRVMIGVQKTCKRWNRGELILADVPERIHEALDLAGFIPLFTFYDTAIEAVGNC